MVVNLKTNKKTGLRFEKKEEYGEEALGILYLPPNYASAWIIDGQHRLLRLRLCAAKRKNLIRTRRSYPSSPMKTCLPIKR